MVTVFTISYPSKLTERNMTTNRNKDNTVAESVNCFTHFLWLEVKSIKCIMKKECKSYETKTTLLNYSVNPRLITSPTLSLWFSCPWSFLCKTAGRFCVLTWKMLYVSSGHDLVKLNLFYISILKESNRLPLFVWNME